MTQRKPPAETVADFVERQIEEARERGDFDGLRGHGRPLPGLGRPDDELWWVRRKLRDEHVTDLPPAMQARRARDLALLAAAAADDEADVRRVLEAANEQIRRINRTATTGPPTATMPVDVEEVVAQWRLGHPSPPPPPPDPVDVPAVRGWRGVRGVRSWWRRLAARAPGR